MKHYGDITKISGYEVPIVDVITGGSPCQDLSVAGKRAGLAGERSGLFMEQIRIVKEMRERDVRENGRSGFLVRPRYMVWENVPGAFSSGNPKGSDFAAVIEEIIKVSEPNAVMRVCVPDGGWTKSGCFYSSDGAWSIAWRVHDAQFWGVPQRRKRISLVADFGGLSAPEILFERKGVRRDSAESGEERKDSAGTTSESIGDASRNQIDEWINAVNSSAKHQQDLIQHDLGVARSIAPGTHASGSHLTKTLCTTTSEPILLESNQNHATVQTDGISTALPASMGMGGGYVPMITEPLPFDTTQVTSDKNWSNPKFGDPCHPLASGAHPPAIVFENHSQDTRYRPLGDICQTVSSTFGMGGNNQPLVVNQNETNGYAMQGFGDYKESDKVSSLKQRDYKDSTDLVVTTFGIDRAAYNQGQNAKYDFSIEEEKIGAQTARGPGAVFNNVVRRLTPLECERLQGFPDGWTDIGEWVDSKGKKHKDADSPRYKALGNSVAVGYANGKSGFWCWLARRICSQYERQITMASLFDGIGGFPLAFEAAGAIPVWASEIEEFPIAVTKLHFPEEVN